MKLTKMLIPALAFLASHSAVAEENPLPIDCELEECLGYSAIPFTGEIFFSENGWDVFGPFNTLRFDLKGRTFVCKFLNISFSEDGYGQPIMKISKYPPPEPDLAFPINCHSTE